MRLIHFVCLHTYVKGLNDESMTMASLKKFLVCNISHQSEPVSWQNVFSGIQWRKVSTVMKVLRLTGSFIQMTQIRSCEEGL